MSWPIVELGSEVSFIGGSQPAKSEFVYEKRDGFVRLLQIRDYKSDKNLTFIPEKSTKKFCTKDDVMIGRYGPPVFQILRGLEGAYNVALMKAEPSQRVDKDYLYYFLKQPDLFQLIDRLSQRTAGQSGVDMGALKSYPMILPPIPIQKQIAAVLEKAEALRAQCQQMEQELNSLAQSVFLDMFGDPIKNSMDWDKEQLNKVSDRIVDCPHSTPKWAESGVLCIRTSNLTKGGWDFTDERYVDEAQYKSRTSRSEVEPGDIILSREGTIGVAAIVKEQMKLCLGQRLVQVRPSNIYLNSSFLLFQLLFQLDPQRLGQVMAGSTVKHLNMKDIRALEVIVPPVNEQAKFERIINNLNERKENLVNINIELENNFNSLMQRAFKGELNLKDVA